MQRSIKVTLAFCLSCWAMPWWPYSWVWGLRPIGFPSREGARKRGEARWSMIIPKEEDKMMDDGSWMMDDGWWMMDGGWFLAFLCISIFWCISLHAYWYNTRLSVVGMGTLNKDDTLHQTNDWSTTTLNIHVWWRRSFCRGMVWPCILVVLSTVFIDWTSAIIVDWEWSFILAQSFCFRTASLQNLRAMGAIWKLLTCLAVTAASLREQSLGCRDMCQQPIDRWQVI